MSDDVARAAVLAVQSQPRAPVMYELGGPEVSTFRQLMAQDVETIQRRRLINKYPLYCRADQWGSALICEQMTLGLVPRADHPRSGA